MKLKYPSKICFYLNIIFAKSNMRSLLYKTLIRAKVVNNLKITKI